MLYYLNIYYQKQGTWLNKFCTDIFLLMLVQPQQQQTSLTITNQASYGHTKFLRKLASPSTKVNQRICKKIMHQK